MSMLTDLRALVNQCECDEKCNDCTARPCYYEQLRDTLDTDTIRALLDVAEAVDKGKLTAARHSLYPLVKEADDE